MKNLPLPASSRSTSVPARIVPADHDLPPRHTSSAAEIPLRPQRRDLPEELPVRPEEAVEGYLRKHGQQISLGYFETKEDAARAYDKAAIRQYGPDTYLNRV